MGGKVYLICFEREINKYIITFLNVDKKIVLDKFVINKSLHSRES